MLTFSQFLVEDEQHRLLKRKTGEFFRKHPEHRRGLNSPDFAAGSCYNISKKLHGHLKRSGIDSCMVSARHWIPPTEHDAHPSLHGISGDKIFHFAVRSGNHILDTTGAQFGNKYRGPQVMHIDDFKKRWKHVADY